MSTADTISCLSFLVSLLAFAVSWKSYSVSKRNLLISEQQHLDRNLGIALHYIDAYKWREGGEVYISFALMFSNKSTLPNTISKIELQIDYRGADNILRMVKTQPDSFLKPINLKNYSDVFSQPLILSEKSVRSGWISYKLPEYLTDKGLTIDLYKIHAETVDNKNIYIDTHIINEV